MARGQKHAVVIIADVGSHITQPECEVTKAIIGKFLQQPFLNQKKFEAALVLCGTSGTSNNLNRDMGEGYDNVTTAQQLDIADSAELLEVVKTQVTPSASATGDLLDALIVALQLLDERCDTGKWTRSIAMVSSASTPFNAADQDLDQIESQIQDTGCKLTFAEIDLAQSGVKSELHKALHGIGAAVHVIQSVERADVVSQSPPVAPTTVFRGPLEISDELSIGVWAYNSVSAVTAPSLKKMSIPATEDDADRQGVVKMEREHFSVDDPDHAIAPEDKIPAYKYGSEYVPFNDADIIAFKWQCEKSFKTLGFMPRSRLKRDHFADKCVKLAPTPGDPAAANAMALLKQALLNQDMVGITRLVKRKNAGPELGVLLPSPDPEEVALLFIKLPFAEDLREFEFPPLDATCAAPTAQQLDAAENLINGLSIGDEWAPENVRNPHLQRLHGCLQARAHDPDCELQLDDDDSPYGNGALIGRVQAVHQRPKATEGLQAFHEAFQLVKNPVKAAAKKRTYWGDRDRTNKGGGGGTGSGSGGSGSNGNDIFALDLGLAGDVKPKIEADGTNASNQFSAASFGGNDATDGTGVLNPAKMFRGMVSSAGGDKTIISRAIAGLTTRVADLLTASSTKASSSGGGVKEEDEDAGLKGAMECVKAYRQACMDALCPVPAFNDYLRSFRDAYKAANKADATGLAGFFTQLVAEKISLITKLEAVDGVSPSEGVEFLVDPHSSQAGGAAPAAATDDKDEDSEEDLFDMLM